MTASALSELALIAAYVPEPRIRCDRNARIADKEHERIEAIRNRLDDGVHVRAEKKSGTRTGVPLENEA
ncbi:MAG: hypothetical protein ACFB20_04190 [Opitutales bacterium]